MALDAATGLTELFDVLEVFKFRVELAEDEKAEPPDDIRAAMLRHGLAT